MTKQERIDIVMSSHLAQAQPTLAMHLAQHDPDEMPLEEVFEALLIANKTAQKAQMDAEATLASQIVSDHLVRKCGRLWS